MNTVYFDNAATTRLDDEVLREMLPYMKEEYGNASSIYKLGRLSKEAVEKARRQVAAAINAKPDEIYFTSGGTESDNAVIRGIAYAYKSKGNHIITSKIEHPAVLETLKELEKEGFTVTYVGVTEDGIIDMDALKAAVTDKTTLITVMYANNEIGTLQPVGEIGKFAREKGILFHTDAVQAIGSEKIDVVAENIDALSMSAHKFYGPNGIGALYVKKGVRFQKFIFGGHQEKNKRAGTENVPAIVGMGKAIELAYRDIDEHNAKIKALRDYYVSEVLKRIPYVKINGDMEKRLPGNANISFKFIEGEGMLLNLDLKGICASSGSACTSGSLDPSHVLLAIGLPHEIAHGSLRITIGKYNTKEDVDYLLTNLEEIVRKLRDMSPLYDKFLSEQKENG